MLVKIISKLKIPLGMLEKSISKLDNPLSMPGKVLSKFLGLFTMHGKTITISKRSSDRLNISLSMLEIFLSMINLL
jgi:hypothetical protein